MSNKFAICLSHNLKHTFHTHTPSNTYEQTNPLYILNIFIWNLWVSFLQSANLRPKAISYDKGKLEMTTTFWTTVKIWLLCVCVGVCVAHGRNGYMGKWSGTIKQSCKTIISSCTKTTATAQYEKHSCWTSDP